MIPRRAVAKDIIGALLLTALLLCGPHMTPRGRADGRHRSTPTPSVVAPTSQLSGDGLIAFESDDGQIYVMNSDGSDVRRVTDTLPGIANRYPAFSPDSTRIAFIRDDGNDHALYVVGIDGWGLERITDSAEGLAEPAWSPDGTRIAFMLGYDPTLGSQANLSACPPEIYVIDLGTGIRLNPTRGLGGTDPAWSPDGTRIAFSTSRDENYEIYTAAPDGNHPQRLTDTPWAEADPAWSPDGSRIAYTAHLFQGGFGCGFMPTGLAAVASQGTPSVYIMNTDGTNQTELPRTTGGREPAWSPDSSRIALVINGRGGPQIYVTDADGASLLRPTKLTWDSTQKASPTWASAGIRR